MVKVCSWVANIVYVFCLFSIMKEIDHGVDLAVDGKLILKLFFCIFPWIPPLHPHPASSLQCSTCVRHTHTHSGHTKVPHNFFTHAAVIILYSTGVLISPWPNQEGIKLRSTPGTRAISTKSRRELPSSFFSCEARRRRKFKPFWQNISLFLFWPG